jgi:hypothetical protein
VWPAVRIIVRGDSGFCRDELMNWCDEHGVSFIPGFARNQRLRRIIHTRYGLQGCSPAIRGLYREAPL